MKKPESGVYLVTVDYCERRKKLTNIVSSKSTNTSRRARRDLSKVERGRADVEDGSSEGEGDDGGRRARDGVVSRSDGGAGVFGSWDLGVDLLDIGGRTDEPVFECD